MAEIIVTNMYWFTMLNVYSSETTKYIKICCHWWNRYHSLGIAMQKCVADIPSIYSTRAHQRHVLNKTQRKIMLFDYTTKFFMCRIKTLKALHM